MATNQINITELLALGDSFGIDLDEVSPTELGRKCNALSRSNDAPYPNKKDFTTFFAYSKGKVVGENITNEMKKDIEAQYPGCIIEPNFDQAGFDAAMKKYGEHRGNVERLFREGVIYNCGVAGHKNASKAYSIAYDRGHSAGYEEVASYFEELAELLK
jgi:hypothetical protein